MLAACLVATASASAAAIVNGGFETGNLEGWSLYQSSPAVKWRVPAAGEEIPPPPISGQYAVSSQAGEGTAILYQDVPLEPASSHQLQLTFGYRSEAPIRIPNPDSLESGEVGVRNQQVRVDVMKPGAAIASVAPGDILATVFASSESENTEGE
jgi:hypothetical protein